VQVADGVTPDTHLAPAFALLHGGGQGSWVWEPTMRALTAKGARVLALDVPGCGVKRGRDPPDMTVDLVAAELLADLAKWTAEPVTLVGHSLGGVVLTRMAEAAPERFARLIYASCAAPLPGQTVGAMIGGGVQGASDSEVGWPA
jgi:pimeloyl-ACP methyl ester carboxylesterase